jgi:hypothetical protein
MIIRKSQTDFFLSRHNSPEFPPPARPMRDALQQVIDWEKDVFSVFMAPPGIPPRLFFKTNPIYK